MNTDWNFPYEEVKGLGRSRNLDEKAGDKILQSSLNLMKKYLECHILCAYFILQQMKWDRY